MQRGDAEEAETDGEEEEIYPQISQITQIEKRREGFVRGVSSCYLAVAIFQRWD
jgi:hypothetical protein